jgi:hypothetical protein
VRNTAVRECPRTAPEKPGPPRFTPALSPGITVHLAFHSSCDPVRGGRQGRRQLDLASRIGQPFATKQYRSLDRVRRRASGLPESPSCRT